MCSSNNNAFIKCHLSSFQGAFHISPGHWANIIPVIFLSSLGSIQPLATRLLSLNQDIHWREGTTLVMLAKPLLWLSLLSLNQDIHWREGTTLVMLAKLLLWVCLLSLNQDIHSTTNQWKFQLHAESWEKCKKAFTICTGNKLRQRVAVRQLFVNVYLLFVFSSSNNKFVRIIGALTNFKSSYLSYNYSVICNQVFTTVVSFLLVIFVFQDENLYNIFKFRNT